MGGHTLRQGSLYDHPTLLSNRKSDDSTISSFAYSVDKTGNRTKLTLANGDYAEYLYDQTYQLTREHRKDSQNATLYYNNFYYDPAGNRTRLEYNDGTSTTTTSYLYNSADQLTRETTGATVTSYLYDPNGNLTKKDDGTNVCTYKYDFRNLVTDYDGPGSNNDSTYKYGASGLRVQKTVGGSTTTKYYHDGLNVVAEYNGSNQLQRTYVTPGLDQNLTMTASASTYYYLSDALGSIRQLLDPDQATQNSYDYEAFGKVYGSPTENVPQPFRFTGREWDGESGLYYYRMRNYRADIGRFLARDPLALLPAYAYVAGLPTMFIDPLGLGWLSTAWAFATALPGAVASTWVSGQAWDSWSGSVQSATGIQTGSLYGNQAAFQMGQRHPEFGGAAIIAVGAATGLQYGPQIASAARAIPGAVTNTVTAFLGAANSIGTGAIGLGYLGYRAYDYVLPWAAWAAMDAQNFLTNTGLGQFLWQAFNGALPTPPGPWQTVPECAGYIAGFFWQPITAGILEFPNLLGRLLGSCPPLPPGAACR
jgi:RHS repeat-associated protein